MLREAQYDAKVARRERINASITRSAELQTRDYIIDDLLAANYGATPQGTFENADRLILRWERPDWFEFLPDPERPFAFIRASGEKITPGRMVTDGGSIPRWFWVRESLSHPGATRRPSWCMTGNSTCITPAARRKASRLCATPSPRRSRRAWKPG